MKKIIYTATLLLSTLAFSQVGINTENPQGIFNIDGGKNNATTGAPTAPQQKDDFVVLADGSVGIGTTTPNASAILELNVNELASGSKKGFLAPKVPLKAYNDATTIPSPATGLLVYNTGEETTFTYQGYVFWDGTQWKTLDGKLLKSGTIGSLSCTGASLSPITYASGVAYDGSLAIPYSNGDGGAYAAQTIGPVNGLTATLVAGNFAIGAGELIYTVTGTPTVSSPSTTEFALNIGGKTCSAVVGAGAVLQPGEYQFYNYEVPASTTGLLSSMISNAPILGGKVRIDPYFSSSSNQGTGVSWNPRVYNVHSSNIKIWYAAVSSVDNFRRNNVLLAPGGYMETDNGMYLGYGSLNDIATSTPRTVVTGSEDSSETETIDFVVDGVWYRVTIYIIIDNKNTSDNNDNVRVINITAQRMSGY
jgi:hypothetical protein